MIVAVSGYQRFYYLCGPALSILQQAVPISSLALFGRTGNFWEAAEKWAKEHKIPTTNHGVHKCDRNPNSIARRLSILLEPQFRPALHLQIGRCRNSQELIDAMVKAGVPSIEMISHFRRGWKINSESLTEAVLRSKLPSPIPVGLPAPASQGTA